MSTDWRDRRADNAINSTEAEGTVLSQETKAIVTAISHGDIDADTAVAEYLTALRNDG